MERGGQLKPNKAALKEPEVQFVKTKLPDHVLRSIDKSLRQFEEGKSSSLEEFCDKHLIRRN